MFIGCKEGEHPMGKLIICSGKQASRPYYIKLTNTEIYSIEELCYFLYHNIDMIDEKFFQTSLVTWISENLDLTERADKLLELINADAGLKDLVVCILCSADYYTEPEIKQLLREMDEAAMLTPLELKKKKADNYLRYRQFTEAATEYETLLNGKEAVNLSNEEYGNLLHNLAVVQLNTVGVSVATENFKQAYERNHNPESLKQYLYALIISKQDEKFIEEATSYGVNKESQIQLQMDMDFINREAETSDAYKEINELLECKQAGKINQYYQMADDLIRKWKQKFRRENM